jgi:hypothetical protein
MATTRHYRYNQQIYFDSFHGNQFGIHLSIPEESLVMNGPVD